MKSFLLYPSAFILLILFSACASPISIPTAAPANPGDIIYQDEFEKNTTGWDRVSNANGIMDYDGGGYRIMIQQPSFNLWSTPEKNFSDVRVEADVTKLSGPDENRAGLICPIKMGITISSSSAVMAFMPSVNLLEATHYCLARPRCSHPSSSRSMG